jgi:pyruvate dehydrogenase complex dehydrogenase (E1) component
MESRHDPDAGQSQDWGDSLDDLTGARGKAQARGVLLRVLGRADEPGIDLPPVMVTDRDRPHAPRICNGGAADLLGGLFVAGGLGQLILLLIRRREPGTSSRESRSALATSGHASGAQCRGDTAGGSSALGPYRM